MTMSVISSRIRLIRCHWFSSVIHTVSSNPSNHQPIKTSKMKYEESLFNLMIDRKPQPSAVECNRVLTRLLKMKQYVCVCSLFKKISIKGIDCNEFTISIVIKCFTHLHHTDYGFSLLGSCIKKGLMTDAFIFSALLNGLIMEDKIGEAEKLFNKLLIEHVCEADVVMYTTMIKGFCKLGNNEMAISLLKNMDEMGWQPDVVAYNTVIDGLCKDEAVDKALKLLRVMILDKGIRPTVITYTSLIRAVCLARRFKELNKLIVDMEKNNSIMGDTQLFNVFIDYY